MDYETLWLRVETMVLGLMEQHGETRNSLGPKLGLGRNTLGRCLLTDDQRGSAGTVRPAFDVAFQVAEHFNVKPASLLAPFAPDAPEVLMGLLPCPQQNDLDDEVLRAIASIGDRITHSTGLEPNLWFQRRVAESGFTRIYNELEELELRRHYENEVVAGVCRRNLTDATVDERIGTAQAIRLTGMVGLWGSIQRCRHRLMEARLALQSSLAYARRLGDLSLYANQLQRSAYVFFSLDASDLAVAVLREASENFRIDRNESGAIYTLVDKARVAYQAGRIGNAERFYSAALELLGEGRTDAFYRTVAAQGLATCRDLQGDVRGALAYLARAVEDADPRHRRLRAALLLTAANIQRRLGNFDQAESSYWEALDICLEDQDADSAIRVCVDLSVCLVSSGRQDRLDPVRETVRKLLPGLRDHRSLQRECEMLLRELWQDSVSLEALSQISRQLEANKVAATSK